MTARFDPGRPLPSALLDRLLALGTLAPSPVNLQPWRFVVVRDPANRRRLRACTFGESRITEAPVVLIVLAYLHPDRTDLDEVVGRMIELKVLDFEEASWTRATATREWERGDGPDLRATRSAMLAVGALIAAADGLGVDTAWIDGAEPEKVRAAFGIPDDHAFCGLLALGYAAEAGPDLGRHALDRVCFAEHFGQPWPSGEPVL